MTIFGRGHVRETALAGLADDPDASRRLSASDRAHLEACERCRRLLEGHRRAARLLASSWQYVSSEQMAVGSGVQRVHGRVAALPAHRPIALSWQAVVLLLLLLVAVAGMGLLVGTSPRPSTLLAPQPFEPQFLAIDAEGRIYASDCLSNLIVRVDAGGASVIAGSGAARMSPGYSGDGGPATSARLNCPFGLAFDTAGNLLFADAGNDRVRRIDPSGTITTLVGSGARGQASAYGGDGGPAALALLRAPIGIAFDAAGNLYIADRDNDRVRKVDTRGIITTIAGDGRSGYSGDGGPATEASLDDPSDIAIDASGNVLFADSNNGRIRLIDPAGRITTVAGTGKRLSSGDGGPADQAAIFDPQEVILDGAGNLYVTETGDHRIRRIDSSGVVAAFAGTGKAGFGGDGGLATQAWLSDPLGLEIDSRGNVYIADRGNRRIRVVDASGTITTFADGS